MWQSKQQQQQPKKKQQRRQLGDVHGITRILSGVGMSAADVLAVVRPSQAERLSRAAALSSQQSLSLPPPAAWREAPLIGYSLTRSSATTAAATDLAADVNVDAAVFKSIDVRVNHFRVDTRNIPTLHFYKVNIQRFNHSKSMGGKPDNPVLDPSITSALVQQLFADWELSSASSKPTSAYAFDGKELLVTTKALELLDLDDDNQRRMIANLPAAPTGSYQVTVHLIQSIDPPSTTSSSSASSGASSGSSSSSTAVSAAVTSAGSWSELSPMYLQGLNIALLAYGRRVQMLEDPSWHIVGANIFSTRSQRHRVAPLYYARQGFLASLKSCAVGLTLVSDLVINCCSATGLMPELMYKASGRYRSFDQMYGDCCSLSRGLDAAVLQSIEENIARFRVKSTHLGRWHRVKCLGPPADHADSAFLFEGEFVTVAEYFVRKTAQQARGYRRLKHPKLPTVDVGISSRKVLMPAELLLVPSPQAPTFAVYRSLINECSRYATVTPSERMQHISSDNNYSVVSVLKEDRTARAFGLDAVADEFMSVPARVLPPPTIKYATSTAEPLLQGKWFMTTADKHRFLQSPDGALSDGSYLYGAIAVAQRQPTARWEQQVVEFCDLLDGASRSCGMSLTRGGPPLLSKKKEPNLTAQMQLMKSHGVRIIIVLLLAEDAYGAVKLASDKLVIPTQCVMWKNVTRTPSGFFATLLPKMNAKLGGVNHEIALPSTSTTAPTTAATTGAASASPLVKPSMRVPAEPSLSLGKRSAGTRDASAERDAVKSTSSELMEQQQAAEMEVTPQALSWLFEGLCMLVGIDVSHPESGSDHPSVAAAVGSVDVRASRYVAHLSQQAANTELVASLTEAMETLLRAFQAHDPHGRLPQTMVVYRDGVSEGQYNAVLSSELGSIKSALAHLGYPEDAVKVAIVVCHKNHTTRIVISANDLVDAEDVTVDADASTPSTTSLAPSTSTASTARSSANKDKTSDASRGVSSSSSSGSERSSAGGSEDAKDGRLRPKYLNPCPGLVVGSSSLRPSITSTQLVEFYLNSHTTIHGTNRACRYTLIHDEVGFKISELELLTYWSTYLYARCTRSVSYATPAYYAHWASRRGLSLLRAGGTEADLREISANWSSPSAPSAMFFI